MNEKVRISFVTDVSDIDPQLVATYVCGELADTDLKIQNGTFVCEPVENP